MIAGTSLRSAFDQTLRDLLASGNGARFRVAGDSMYPTIRDGDYVQVVPCDAGQLRRGDIVLASTARGLTAHRIVRTQGSLVMMRGDNAPECDAAVQSGDILGKVAQVEQMTGGLRRFDGSLKIIAVAAAFISRLRHSFWQ